MDYAFIDGAFFADGEIPRPMAEVPHPFVSESIELLNHLPVAERNKVYFIHLNHSNPAVIFDTETYELKTDIITLCPEIFAPGKGTNV